MYRQSEKNLLNSNISFTSPHNMANFHPLTAEISWRVWGNRVSRVSFVTAPTLLSGRQPDFAQCLAVSWAGTLYIHFRGLLPLREFCQVQNSLCFSLTLSYIGSVTARHLSRRRQLCSIVFSHDRAAIPFDIGRSNCLVDYILQ